MIHYESFLTRQLDGFNTTGCMEKRFTVQVSATELANLKARAEWRQNRRKATQPHAAVPAVFYDGSRCPAISALRGLTWGSVARVSTVIA